MAVTSRFNILARSYGQKQRVASNIYQQQEVWLVYDKAVVSNNSFILAEILVSLRTLKIFTKDKYTREDSRFWTIRRRTQHKWTRN